MLDGHRWARACRAALLCAVASAALPTQRAAAQSASGAGDAARTQLDEIIVVARRREESLQDAPLAVSAFNAQALEARGITSLGDFIHSPTPFLQISPYAGSTSIPIIGIRGLATDDPGQGANESAVGVYLDGVYLGRAQGSLAELADVEQIEVLRGPQGTLFGRNALGGAINIVSKKPTGRLELDQTLEAGSYDELRALSHLNLPAVGGLKVKTDFLYARRDGWVRNRAPGASDFFEYKRVGGRLDVLWDLSERFSAEYVYDISFDDTATGYVQRTTPNDLSPLPVTARRLTRSVTPIPLRPSKTDTQGHAVTATYRASDWLTLKSISAYRELKYDAMFAIPDAYVHVPLGGPLALSGFMSFQDLDQNQFSQEFQATGAFEHAGIGSVAYAAGLYYFREHVATEDVNGAPILSFPAGFGDPGAAQIVQPFTPFATPNSRSRIRTSSKAAYAQVSLTPDAWDKRVELTVGLRYTDDRKVGRQLAYLGGPSSAAFELNSSSLDYNLSASFRLAKDVKAYVRNATGYRAGGVSLRDPLFVPFKDDSADTWEIGLKSELWDRRARLNLAAFHTDFHDMRTSFSDPANPTVTRLFNAKDVAKIKGVEAELTLLATPDLLINGAYSHLATHVAPQPNPFNPAIIQPFALAQAPRDSGSLSADWTFARLEQGRLSLHADAYWTSPVVGVPQLVGTGSSYGLYNARLTWDYIPAFQARRASVSVWVKNLTNADYAVWEMAWIGPTASSRLIEYGAPRTVGLSVTLGF